MEENTLLKGKGACWYCHLSPRCCHDLLHFRKYFRISVLKNPRTRTLQLKLRNENTSSSNPSFSAFDTWTQVSFVSTFRWILLLFIHPFHSRPRPIPSPPVRQTLPEISSFRDRFSTGPPALGYVRKVTSNSQKRSCGQMDRAVILFSGPSLKRNGTFRKKRIFREPHAIERFCVAYIMCTQRTYVYKDVEMEFF